MKSHIRKTGQFKPKKLSKCYKNKKNHRFYGGFGAAGQIRTADLILTKDALYLLSYSSKADAPFSRGICGDREGT